MLKVRYDWYITRSVSMLPEIKLEQMCTTCSESVLHEGYMEACIEACIDKARSNSISCTTYTDKYKPQDFYVHDAFIIHPLIPYELTR